MLIGGGNVNVKVSGKTELKGAVLASATDKLSFDTGSFTYSDIRDKDKSSTLGGGLSWSKEYGTKSNGQAKESEYGFDAEYGFKDKRQLNRAVIGTGAIIIRDNPNQDIASLKRDVTFAQIGTKNTGVSLEFDSEILDVVLNPVKTYNDIKNNSIRSGKIIETVADGITKAISEEEKGNAVKWTNVGNYIYDSFAYRHASRDFVEENPEIASIMSDPNATPVQKQFAQQLHLNYISDQLGIPIGKLSIYNSDLPGPAGESAGMFVKETGDIYLNTGIYAEEETLSTTLGHEVSHAIDQTSARDYGEDYADLMGTNLNDSLNTEFGLANLPEIKNNVRTSEEWREKYKDDSLIINNNRSAETLKHDNIEQKLLEYFDRRYWQAIRAGDIEEANRVKAEWEQTETIILNKIQLSLDATGIIDPTPISDGTNAVISALRGNYIEVGLSAVSIIPFAGDIIGKGGKYGLKYSDEITNVVAKSIPDDAFIRLDPSKFDKSISELGIQKRFFNDEKVWMTKYGDIKNVKSVKELETILYRKNLWPSVEGRFSEGATLRVVNNVDNAVAAGVTNRTNGVRQWRITRDVSPNDLEIIGRISK